MTENQGRFVRALAEYLGGTNQAHMSIGLQMGRPEARMWADIRTNTPLSGYPTVDEAEESLIKFFGWKR